MCKTCLTCKHWGLPGESVAREGEYRICSAAVYNGYGAGNPIPPDTKMLVSDSEGYHAWVTTRSDFGCVLWEQEEDGGQEA